jgi:hypothetical protein
MVGRRSLRTEQNGFVVVGGTEEVEGGGRRARERTCLFDVSLAFLRKDTFSARALQTSNNNTLGGGR